MGWVEIHPSLRGHLVLHEASQANYIVKLNNFAEGKINTEEGEVFPQNSDSPGPRSLGEIEGEKGGSRVKGVRAEGEEKFLVI